MRRGVPGAVEPRLARQNLLVGLSLPAPVVDIDQRIDRLGTDAAGRGDLGAGRDAARERARVDLARAPARRDALGDRARLGATEARERQVGATAKPLGLDAFDMAVPDEKYLGHRSTPGSGACRRGGGSTGHLARCPVLVVK